MEGTWSLSVPLTGRIPHDRETPSLGSERDEQIEAFPLFSFLPSSKITWIFVTVLPAASSQLLTLCVATRTNLLPSSENTNC